MRRHLSSLLSRVDGWPRRLAAALCLLIAAVSAVGAHTRQPSRSENGVAVVVAARDLPIGITLTAADVRTSRWPAALAPPRGFAVIGLAVGRRLAAPLARGEPVTLTRVVGRELTAGLDADHVACAVATSGDVSVLVHAGDRVDLLAAPSADPLASSSSAGAAVVARDVQVLAVLAGEPSDSSSTGSELIVSTTRTTALALAGLTGSRVLAVVGRSP